MATLNENSRISRKTIIMIVVGLTAAMIAILFCLRYPCICGRIFHNSPNCTKNQYIKGKPDEKGDATKIEVKCNEFIIDPTHPEAPRYRDSLIARCFKLVRTCDCTPAFELWANPIGEPIDVGTVAGTIVRGGTIGIEPGGLMPNVIIHLDSLPIDPNAKNRFDSTVINGSICTDINSNKKGLIIAIVDTGVDTLSDASQNRLNAYGWNRHHNPSRCISNSSEFGLQILDPRNEPVDSLGHGTSVNAVATKASHPNYLDAGLNLQFLNINIFDVASNSCTLFDALCGLNYSVHQKAEIVNISWGFDFNPIDESLKNSVNETIKKVIVGAANTTLFIAGLGNDSKEISNDHAFYPACLANSVSNLMAIGALSFDTSDIAGFSNYSKPEIMTFCTEGEAILAAFPHYLHPSSSTQKEVSGTSYATPLASRIAASFWVRNPGLSASEVKAHFVNFLNPLQRQSLSHNYMKYRALTVQQIPGLVCSKPLHNQLQ